MAKHAIGPRDAGLSFGDHTYGRRREGCLPPSLLRSSVGDVITVAKIWLGLSEGFRG